MTLLVGSIAVPVLEVWWPTWASVALVVVDLGLVAAISLGSRAGEESRCWSTMAVVPAMGGVVLASAGPVELFDWTPWVPTEALAVSSAVWALATLIASCWLRWPARVLSAVATGAAWWLAVRAGKTQPADDLAEVLGSPDPLLYSVIMGLVAVLAVAVVVAATSSSLPRPQRVQR